MHALYNRVGQYVDIDRAAFDALDQLPHRLEDKRPGEVLIREGQTVDSLFVIESGWAIRFRMLEDGRRQIVNFMLPGDSFDMMSLTQAQSDHTVSASTPVTLRRIGAKRFLRAVEEQPQLSIALWWSAIQEESILRAQIVRIGRHSAIERVAHLILELNTRVNSVMQTQDSFLPLPVPQSLFADALGLSIVHISRTLTALRSKNLISTPSGGIQILDREKLAKLAQFEPDYLRVKKLRL